MDRRRDHGAGNVEPLGDMALHLRAEHQFGLQLGDLGLDFEIVVGDQRLSAARLGGLAHFSREFPRVGPEADDLEAEFGSRAPRAAAIACVASPKMKTRLPVR